MFVGNDVNVFRSIEPVSYTHLKSGGYNPNYVGPQIQRDYAYHQGTAWPWLMGFYMEAYLRIYKAVSYTHLDVYKRQDVGSAVPSGSIS